MRTERIVEPYIGILEIILRDLQTSPANPTQIATSVDKLNKMFQIVRQESAELAGQLQPLCADCNKIATDTLHSARARDELLKQRLQAMIQTLRTWQAHQELQVDRPTIQFNEFENRALHAEQQLRDAEARYESKLKAVQVRYDKEMADQRARFETQHERVFTTIEARQKNQERQWQTERQSLLQQMTTAMETEKSLRMVNKELEKKLETELEKARAQARQSIQEMQPAVDPEPTTIFANLKLKVEQVRSLWNQANLDAATKTIPTPLIDMRNRTTQMLHLADLLLTQFPPGTDGTPDTIRPDDLSAAIYSPLPPAGLVAATGKSLAPLYMQATSLQYQLYLASQVLGWQLIYPAVGEIADTRLHQWAEADIEITNDSALEGTIASVKRPGIAHHTTVLRKAEVKRYLYITQRPSTDDDDDLLEG